VNKEIKSLYRIYRSKTFGEVIGQNHVTQTLSNQIESGKIAHAYLFCGTRGVGKTSVARILAREVQKDGIQTYKTENGDLDIFEIDAASNNSVQDVRDLIEKVKYPPIFGKYKVYIIDEVHMFSGSAFNAFLKTLEEPPAHVIFILCTTEPHKLLPTVQSRCLRFDFRPVSAQEIEKLISEILIKEQIPADNEAVKLLSEAGAGSVRDTLSFTETAVSFCGKNKLTVHSVCEVLGIIEKPLLKKLFEEITGGETENMLNTCHSFFNKGINTGALVKDFLQVLREEFIRTKNEKIIDIYKIFAELEVNIKTATNACEMFEGACFLAGMSKNRV
jgi:DNA polymerase-3 subunit gamma/tau